MKKLKIIVVLVAIAILLGCIGLNALWVASAPSDELRTVSLPSSSMRLSVGPVKVDVAPELAATGVICAYLSRPVESRQAFIWQVEKAAVDVSVVSAQEPLRENTLCYSLSDKNGQSLGEGTLFLGGDMGLRETRTITIRDVRTKEAARIVISRKPG